MLTQLGEELWVGRTDHRILGIPTRRPIVVIRLPHELLWIHSPAVVTPELRADLDRLGTVKHVIGPNRWHDECLPEFQSAYPTGEFHAAPGLAKSRRNVRFQHSLNNEPHPDWAGEIEQRLVAGMPQLNEVAFWHRRSRTVILADLIFNIGPPARWLERMAWRSAGVWDHFGTSRMGRTMMRDRAAVRTSINHILAWDFDRVIVGHGEVLESGGHAQMETAFAFLHG